MWKLKRMRLELRRGKVEDRGEKREEFIPVGKAWNSYIAKLLVAKKTWESYMDEVLSLSLEEIENFPVVLQDTIANYREQKFEIMLPRFVDYWRGAGGLEEMKLNKEDIFKEV